MTYSTRKSIPDRVLDYLRSLNCKRVYANIEYEVDELRRDIALCKQALSHGIQVNLVHNKSIVEPGVLYAPSSGKAYAVRSCALPEVDLLTALQVYSPYRRLWLKTANQNLGHYLHEASFPEANEGSIRESEIFGPLFETPIPDSIPGFELEAADKAKMAEIWPEGESKANEVIWITTLKRTTPLTHFQILQRFLNSKARTSQMGGVDPLSHGHEDAVKHNRVIKYDADRDRADKDTTSRLR